MERETTTSSQIDAITSYIDRRQQLNRQILLTVTTITCIAGFSVALMFFIFSLITHEGLENNFGRIVIDLAIGACALLASRMAYQGHLKLSARVFSTLMFLLILAFPIWLQIGLHSVILFGYSILILLSGFLFNSNTAFKITLLCILSVIGILVLQQTGLLRIDDAKKPPLVVIAITLITIFAMTGWTTILYARMFDNAINTQEESRRQLALTIEGLMSSEEELRIAKDEAEHANKAKSSFLAMMSHEIRTPMNGILGMAQMLLESDLTEAQRKEYARTIFNSGQSLLAILNDVLDLSKIEAGKIELESLVFSPAQLMREASSLFLDTARGKGLALEMNTDPYESLRLRGDPTRIRQVLINLIGNAIKFTQHGHVRLSLQVADAGLMKKRIRITVEDTGIGIPTEKQDRLFQPFAQIDASITRQFGGTGLGLAIVRLFVELMEGHVGVESENGQGSRFWFDLELDEVDWEQESRLNPRQPTFASPGDSPLNNTILVVEDNPVNRSVVSAMLTKLGFCVEFATNGQEAVDVLTSRSVDPALVFMDCQMPVMDGFEATRLIRQWEQESGLKPLLIVALTAEAYQQDRDNCAAAGMDDFLPKPLVMRDLRKVLSRWLTREVPQENP